MREKITSTIAPAASDSVGEISSKSCLKKKNPEERRKLVILKSQPKLQSRNRIWKREDIQAKLAARFLLNGGS